MAEQIFQRMENAGVVAVTPMKTAAKTVALQQLSHVILEYAVSHTNTEELHTEMSQILERYQVEKGNNSLPLQRMGKLVDSRKQQLNTQVLVQALEPAPIVYRSEEDSSLKQEERTSIEKIIDLTHSLIRNLNQDILNEITSLLKMFNVKLELYYFSNYKEALELLKEHERLIYSNDLIKTFKEDNTLNFIEINKELDEEYLRDLYFTRFFDREDYKVIPTFYQYGPNHPFYKDLVIKALKENRPITNEDIDEIVRKYPYDRNLIY